MADGRRANRAAATAAATAAAPAGPGLETAGLSAPISRAAAGAAGGNATKPPTVPMEYVTLSCLMNAQYHAAREAFLDTVHRWFMFSVIAFGAAALMDIFPAEEKDWIKAVFSAISALLAALDLTFDLSNRARTHAMMRRRYYDLLADVQENSKDISDAQICLERYSGDEEPPYRALLMTCWNLAQKSVYGFKAQRCAIPWWARSTMNVFRYPGHEFLIENAPKHQSEKKGIAEASGV